MRSQKKKILHHELGNLPGAKAITHLKNLFFLQFLSQRSLTDAVIVFNNSKYKYFKIYYITLKLVFNIEENLSPGYNKSV